MSGSRPSTLDWHRKSKEATTTEGLGRLQKHKDRRLGRLRRSRHFGFGDQQPKIPQIRTSWAGNDRVIEFREKTVSRAGLESRRGIEPQCAGSGHGIAVGDSAGGWTIAVDSISAGT